MFSATNRVRKSASTAKLARVIRSHIAVSFNSFSNSTRHCRELSRFQEGKTLQLRAEAFNLLNHPSFSTPVATLNSGAFGKIQSDISGTCGLPAGNPRIRQFALKLVF